MRVFALILLLLNVGVWYLAEHRAEYGAEYGAEHREPRPEKPVESGGRLPRVTELELVRGELVPERPTRSAAGSAALLPAPTLETDSGNRDQDAPLPTAANNLLSPVPVAEGYCVTLGWFDSTAAALAEAPSGATGVKAVELTRELPPLHWVIIPPQSPEQALRQFREIRRQGIDSYLVTEGERRNAISLGLFESLDAARQVQRERISQNINATLAIFPRNQISYALVFEAGFAPGTGAAKAFVTEYQQKFELVEIKRCEGVATPEKNP